MANRFKDFDAAWAESTSAPLVVKVFGTEYQLPAKLPAKVVISIARQKLALKDRAEAEDVPLDAIVEMLEPFFGKGVLAEWLDKDMDVDQLGDIFKWCMAMYSGEDPDAKSEDDEPEGDSPNS